MEKIITWIKGAACFYIIANYIVTMIPQEKYQKYASLFVGVIMVVVVIAPLKNIDSLINVKAIEIADYIPTMNIESSDEAILDEVRRTMRDNICLYADSENISVIECEIAFNIEECEKYGLIKAVDVTIQTSEQENGEVSALLLKKYISQFYKLPMQNIYVNISKENLRGAWENY